MSALASGADWLFIPEAPPEDGWENFMCERLGEVSGHQGSQRQVSLGPVLPLLVRSIRPLSGELGGSQCWLLAALACVRVLVLTAVSPR